MAPRTPCFPDPASPFQSTRRPASRQAVPGGLKGRAAVGPSRTTQAARDRRSLGPLARRRRARTPQAGGRGAWFERRDASFVIAGNRRFPACSQNASRSDDITRELRSLERQRVPERSSAARAFEAVTSSRKPAAPTDTSIPCLGRFQKSDTGILLGSVQIKDSGVQKALGALDSRDSLCSSVASLPVVLASSRFAESTSPFQSARIRLVARQKRTGSPMLI